jgi:acetylornithine deacetylase/succinyl-diaminopimelate desuccinylase-like protein
VLNGGTRPNVIADKARAELQIRLGIDIEHIKSVLEAAVGTRGRLEYSSAHNPVRLFSVPGFEECVVRFTTDVPYLSEWGKPLLLGPGSIFDAHTAHERISKRELGGRRRSLCEPREEAVNMKLALFGYGAMGQLVAAGARNGGDEIGVVLTSKEGELPAISLQQS